MVYIPAGEFVMGSGNPMTKDENPRHKVTLSGYWIYRNLVTVGMYKKFCADTGHPLRSAPAFDPSWVKDDHPILNVSWFDAAAYCAWATVSLPTEAQWEKAARGPTGSEYPWGDNYNLSKVWASSKVKGDAASTTAVGHFGVSGYGCTDMAGNAFQWCLDWYSKDFWSSRESQGIDPLNQSPGNMANRCVRGTDWVYFMTS
jgi:formylglycine-generating enzyme required for sulfatase activity